MVKILDVDQGRNGIEDCFQLLLVFFYLLLGALALGDVIEDGADTAFRGRRLVNLDNPAIRQRILEIRNLLTQVTLEPFLGQRLRVTRTVISALRPKGQDALQRRARVNKFGRNFV